MKKNHIVIEPYRSPATKAFTIGLNGVICGSGNKSMNEKDLKDGGFTEI